MGYKLIREEEKKKDTISYDPNNNDMVTHITEPSDMAQTIKELNSDVSDKDTFSSIDMKSRLENIEISAIICVDSLVSLDFLPVETSFITRSKKRLSVSQQGKGRGEVVAISQGMSQNKTGASVWDRLGGMFRGGNNQ
jgi:hypothetical protein